MGEELIFSPQKCERAENPPQPTCPYESRPILGHHPLTCVSLNIRDAARCVLLFLATKLIQSKWYSLCHVLVTRSILVLP